MTEHSREGGHRRFMRLPVSVPVIGRAAFADTEFPGTVRNIGRGGLMAEFPVMIFPGSFVDLTLHTCHGPLTISGQVVWTEPPGIAIGHGIAFREPRGDDFAVELFSSEDR